MTSGSAVDSCQGESGERGDERKPLCFLCQGTKSSHREEASTLVNVKVGVTDTSGGYKTQKQPCRQHSRG